MAGIHAFQKTILDFYRANGRHSLPWRKTQSPYRILVSELMLQQTQVDRVVPKYKSFLKKFPTSKSLAGAGVSDVLREWHGLGYNRRALYLKRAALKIENDFGGRFPKHFEAIRSLPGVGPYTAGALRTFSWNMPEVFLETNIRRVFIHFFFSHAKKVSDLAILQKIKMTLDHKNPRRWYWALMDYGALGLKKVSNPNRKSRHYLRQSKFLGSRRYARARFLVFLLERGSARARDFYNFVYRDPALLDYRSQKLIAEILHDLTKEGFLVFKKGSWRVAK